MSPGIQDNFVDADWLSLDYLTAECIWEPTDDKPGDGETLHPELRRHLAGDAVERGDFTLRHWRGEFYIWSDGRYVRVSESDTKSRIVHHLKEHNAHVETFQGPADKVSTSRAAWLSTCCCAWLEPKECTSTKAASSTHGTTAGSG